MGDRFKSCHEPGANGELDDLNRRQATGESR